MPHTISLRTVSATASAFLIIILCAPINPARAAADPSGSALPGAVSGWTQVYSNDFTSPDLGDFQVYNGPSPDPGVCWSADHAVVANGELQLRSSHDSSAATALGCTNTSYEYVTGAVKLTTISQTHGMYEIRAKIDAGLGVSFAAQLWPTDNDWNNGIVFMEDNGQPTLASNLATEYNSLTDVINRQTLSVDMTQWHTYGVIWGAGEIEYTIDGRVWGTISSAALPQTPMQLAIQGESWACGANSWEQCASSSSSPPEIDMDVDWMAAYQAEPGTTVSAPISSSASSGSTSSSVSGSRSPSSATSGATVSKADPATRTHGGHHVTSGSRARASRARRARSAARSARARGASAACVVQRLASRGSAPSARPRNRGERSSRLHRCR